MNFLLLLFFSYSKIYVVDHDLSVYFFSIFYKTEVFATKEPQKDRSRFLGVLWGEKTTTCTTIPRYPIFSTRYSVMCKVYTGYCGTSEIEHGLCACTVDNPLAKARGLALRTGAQTMLYLSLVVWPMEFPLKNP